MSSPEHAPSMRRTSSVPGPTGPGLNSTAGWSRLRQRRSVFIPDSTVFNFERLASIAGNVEEKKPRFRRTSSEPLQGADPPTSGPLLVPLATLLEAPDESAEPAADSPRTGNEQAPSVAPEFAPPAPAAPAPAPVPAPIVGSSSAPVVGAGASSRAAAGRQERRRKRRVRPSRDERAANQEEEYKAYAAAPRKLADVSAIISLGNSLKQLPKVGVDARAGVVRPVDSSISVTPSTDPSPRSSSPDLRVRPIPRKSLFMWKRQRDTSEYLHPADAIATADLPGARRSRSDSAFKVLQKQTASAAASVLQMGDVDASPSVSLVDPVVAQAVRATARRKSHEFIAPTQSAAAMATTSSTDSEPLEPKETGVGRQRASLLRENEDVAVAVAVDVRPAASVSGSVTGQEQGAGSGYAIAAVQAEERRPERHRSHHGELGAFRYLCYACGVVPLPMPCGIPSVLGWWHPLLVWALLTYRIVWAIAFQYDNGFSRVGNVAVAVAVLCTQLMSVRLVHWRAVVELAVDALHDQVVSLHALPPEVMASVMGQPVQRVPDCNPKNRLPKGIPANFPVHRDSNAEDANEDDGVIEVSAEETDRLILRRTLDTLFSKCCMLCLSVTLLLWVLGYLPLWRALLRGNNPPEFNASVDRSIFDGSRGVYSALIIASSSATALTIAVAFSYLMLWVICLYVYAQRALTKVHSFAEAKSFEHIHALVQWSARHRFDLYEQTATAVWSLPRVWLSALLLFGGGLICLVVGWLYEAGNAPGLSAFTVPVAATAFLGLLHAARHFLLRAIAVFERTFGFLLTHLPKDAHRAQQDSAVRFQIPGALQIYASLEYWSVTDGMVDRQPSAESAQSHIFTRQVPDPLDVLRLLLALLAWCLCVSLCLLPVLLVYAMSAYPSCVQLSVLASRTTLNYLQPHASSGDIYSCSSGEELGAHMATAFLAYGIVGMLPAVVVWLGLRYIKRSRVLWSCGVLYVMWVLISSLVSVFGSLLAGYCLLLVLLPLCWAGIGLVVPRFSSLAGSAGLTPSVRHVQGNARTLWLCAVWMAFSGFTLAGAWVLQSFLVVHAYARADSAWRTVIALLLQPALRVLVFVAEFTHSRWAHLHYADTGHSTNANLSFDWTVLYAATHFMLSFLHRVLIIGLPTLGTQLGVAALLAYVDLAVSVHPTYAVPSLVTYCIERVTNHKRSEACRTDVRYRTRLLRGLATSLLSISLAAPSVLALKSYYDVPFGTPSVEEGIVSLLLQLVIELSCAYILLTSQDIFLGRALIPLLRSQTIELLRVLLFVGPAVVFLAGRDVVTVAVTS